jgi:hypothetical protein
VRENPLNELRLLDARNHLQAPAAVPAPLDLDPERSLQAARPAHANVLRTRPLRRGARWCAPGPLRAGEIAARSTACAANTDDDALWVKVVSNGNGAHGGGPGGGTSLQVSR